MLRARDHADRDPQRLRRGTVHVLDRGGQPVREHARAGRGLLREQHAELVAAHAHRGVDAASGLAERRGDPHQRAVARAGAVGVVDAFESLDVQQQERERMPVALLHPEQVVEVLLHEAAVVQPGEAVGGAEPLELPRPHREHVLDRVGLHRAEDLRQPLHHRQRAYRVDAVEPAVELGDHRRLQHRQVADQLLGARRLVARQLGQLLRPLERGGPGALALTGHARDLGNELGKLPGYPCHRQALQLLERGPLDDPHDPCLGDLPARLLEPRDRRLHY